MRRFMLAVVIVLVILACQYASNLLDAGPPDDPPSNEIPQTGPPVRPEDAPTLANCPVLPFDNIWNIPIDLLPVHEDSQAYVDSIGADETLHPDFGSGLYEGGPIGIPYMVVSAAQERVPVSFEYEDESDPGPYPIPAEAPIEGSPESDGDRHILILDQEDCQLYELFHAFPAPDGSWSATSGAIFDLRSNQLRPETWTSADAAGLPILPGLIRYEEVAAGEIHHALRFTAPQTQRAYVWPARHFASELTDERYPPMGQRFRLRASFDDSGFSPQVRVITQALKTYGLFLADNGSPWFISGVPDDNWDNDMLSELKEIRGADFEAVDISSLMVDPNSGQGRVAFPTGGSSRDGSTVHKEAECTRSRSCSRTEGVLSSCCQMWMSLTSGWVVGGDAPGRSINDTRWN